MISCGRCSLRQRLDRVIVDQMIVAADAVLDRVEPLARHRRRCAVGQVAAGVEAHAEDGVAGLDQRQHHRRVGLRPRMRLDVGIGARKQRLGAVDRQRLDDVRRRAALVVALARVALGIFVGEHRPLRVEDGAADDVLARDQLDLVLLPVELHRDRGGDRTLDGIGEKAFVTGDLRSGAHSAASNSGWLSLATRSAWRPPP